ncbi:MAG: hypothetical protein C0432_02815 [Candidatus Puniceispirillum sp.]|nr:hypothetical protein [Candidatus Pelagibacter sp.]MBA4283208.1 hypothetical protein [Candidatus Puniceispirillum sp.]
MAGELEKEQRSINARVVFYSFVKIFLIISFYFLIHYKFQNLLKGAVDYNGFIITPNAFLLAATILMITIQFTSILKYIIWDYYFPVKRKVTLSSLLINIINLIINLVCIFGVLKFVFKQPIEHALAATGAFGVVLGFGLQRMVLDLSVGISIDMDKSFQMGNWIHIRHNNLDIIGQIVQMNWRVISVKSADNKLFQIPNNIFGATIVTNLSRPTLDAEFEIKFIVPYIINEKKVLTVALFALDSVAASDYIFDYKCRIDTTSLDGVGYKIRYFLRPDKMAPGKVRHFIHAALMRFFRSENIPFATSFSKNLNDSIYLLSKKFNTIHNEQLKDVVSFSSGEPFSNVDLVKNVDLFAVFDDKKIEHITQKSTLVKFNKGDTVCKQGDLGQSLYIVKEGFLRVFINNDEGREKQVGVLIPEDFFGEMSLLTGAPRSATVVADSKVSLLCITVDVVIPLLSENDKFYYYIARTIAERQSINAKILNQKEDVRKKNSLIRELEEKIRTFSRKFLSMFK